MRKKAPEYVSNFFKVYHEKESTFEKFFLIFSKSKFRKFTP